MRSLLFIGSVWPEPRSTAAGARTLAILRGFSSAGYSVTFATAASPGEHAEGVQAVADRTQAIELNDSSFDAFVAGLAPDVVVFDRFMTEEQFGWRVEAAVPDALRVLDTVDLHSLRRVRGAGIDAGSSVEVDALVDSDDAKREVASIYRSDLSLVVSSVELSLLRDELGVPSDLLVYVPLLFDNTAAQTTDAVEFDQRSGFVIIGNYMHPPNREGVQWLAQELWPRVRARLPRATCRVYGAYVPSSVASLDDPDAGFHVEGWAPDAHTALSGARVCLAPLRSGAGLKGKIADAWVAGTPVVTTPIGAEGMGRGDRDWGGVVAEAAEALAEGAVSLHEDPSLWLRASDAGRRIVASEFDAAAHLPLLLGAVEACSAEREARRRRNFVGAMLRHHGQRSTEYMSRWIEEKNRRKPSG